MNNSTNDADAVRHEAIFVKALDSLGWKQGQNLSLDVRWSEGDRTLILNINVYLEDERSGKMQFAKSVDIRGNTDESWRRGLDYLLRNYLLGG